MPEQPNLQKLIVARIKQGGRITFAEFMQMALYEPGLGYYTRQPNLIGARGDFYTAPHLTPRFGEMVARQLTELWELLDKPTNFQLVEMGAGQGLLAGDILAWIYQQKPDLWPHLTYNIVEVSDFLIRSQRRRLQEIALVTAAPNLLDKVSWRSLDEMSDGAITGVFFSNELVDAFPVHLVQVAQGQLQEVYVEIDEQSQLQEKLGPLSTSELVRYFDRLHLNLVEDTYPEDYRSEVNLQASRWIAQVAARLQRGYVLTIDYGYTADKYYSPSRTTGTLQAYFNHRINYDPYQRVGEQDLTAHVDFTSLMLNGEQNGLQTVGLTNQATFLAALGIGQYFLELSTPRLNQTDPNALLTERNALQKLINPGEMGNFGVLLQSKNLAPTVPVPSGFSLNL